MRSLFCRSLVAHRAMEAIGKLSTSPVQTRRSGGEGKAIVVVHHHTPNTTTQVTGPLESSMERAVAVAGPPTAPLLLALWRSLNFPVSLSFALFVSVQVNNAAVSFNEIDTNSVEHAETVLRTNFYGAKMLTEALLPLFRQSPATSRILNISSQLGLLNVSAAQLFTFVSSDDLAM